MIPKLRLIKLIVLCFVWVVSIDATQAQQTFSKTYNLEVGFNNNAEYFFLTDNGFVVGTNHSGNGLVISALSRFDLEGNITDLNSFPDFVFGPSRSAVPNKNGFEIAGHRWSNDKNLARGLELIKVNDDLEFIERIELFYQEERSTNLPGIVKLNDNQKAVYGSFIKFSAGIDGGAYVAILDKATDSIQNEIIFRQFGQFPYLEYNVFDLQATVDSNLLYIAETRRTGVPPTGTGFFYEIVKFDQEGEVINRIESDDTDINVAIFQDDEGGIYFYKRRTPFLLDTILPFADRAGGLVKINSDLDSVLWSFQIQDFDGIGGSRGHTIFGITQLKDGNLLASGRVGLTLNGEDETIGFLCKFTKEGEVLWVREYGIPIPDEFVEESLIGVLGSGFLRDCKELEDGRILCMGGHAYARPETSFYQELWMLMLDADGCLEPGCDPTLILTSTAPVQTFQEGNIYPNPVTDMLHITEVEFDEYKIFDLTGRLVQEGEYSPTIDLSAIQASGMYVLQLKEDGRLKSVFSLVKS